MFLPALTMICRLKPSGIYP